MADDVFNLAAQLGFYFFLGVFPALMVLVATISLLPLEGVLSEMFSMLQQVAPPDVVQLLRDRSRMSAAAAAF